MIYSKAVLISVKIETVFSLFANILLFCFVYLLTHNSQDFGYQAILVFIVVLVVLHFEIQTS